MIRRLVELARAAGTEATPYWPWMSVRVCDLSDWSVRDDRRRVLVPQRSSDLVQKPGFLAEKLGNLGRSDVRAALVALCERYSGATGHPLPGALADALRAPERLLDAIRTTPKNGGKKAEEKDWIAFAWEGRTAWDVPALRAAVEADALDHCGVGSACRCLGCGRVGSVAAKHLGLGAYSPAAPVLVTANRGVVVSPLFDAAGVRRLADGDQSPTCAECMVLYTRFLNEAVETGRWVGSDAHASVGDEVWVVSGANRSASVVAVWRDLEAHRLSLVPDDQARMYKTYKRPDKGLERSIIRMAYEGYEPPRAAEEFATSPAFWAGYTYGALEWLAYMCEIKNFPLMDAATAAPRRVLGEWGVRCHAAVERFVDRKRVGKPSDDAPPRITKRSLRHWMRVLLEGVAGKPLPERVGPEEVGDFYCGWVYFVGQRMPMRRPRPWRGRVTPWQQNLIDALHQEGVFPWPPREGEEYEREVDVGRRKRRLDIALPQFRMFIEVDGSNEGPNARDFSDDSLRTAQLGAVGWRLLNRVPNRRLKTMADARRVAQEVLTMLWACYPAESEAAGIPRPATTEPLAGTPVGGAQEVVAPVADAPREGPQNAG